MKIFIKTRKFISVITALCLLISFVIGPTAANAMTNEEATAKYKQIFKDFMLPYNYGQITSAHYAGTDRVIINIQDLHCHPKVQKNISNIIEIFDRSFGVKKVYLEGVYGQLSTKWITDRMDNVKKGEILEKMLNTGRLTGAEYYSATSGKTEIISGLEEKYPYLENLKRFGKIIEDQEEINLILKALDESLFKVKQQYYTKRQYKLEELSKNYREGTITPQKYYALLSKHIDKLGIDLSKYENTFTYMNLLEMQKNLDYSKISTELQNLILLLRENLANSAYQMLVDNTENFSKIDKLYGYIVRISRELGLDLTVNFPNLDNYFGYIEFSQKINPLELIVEEKKLTEEINTRFSETKAQREVVFLTNFEKYLKDYVSSKITSDDYEYYKENIGTFRQLWNKYVDNKVLSLLDDYIAEADKFYKINTDRNIYFTNNMFKESDVLNKLENEKNAKGDLNKIIDNMKGVKEVDIVITGGFHSQTVTEILKNHGVSYIVITPNVTDGVKLAEETYYEIAKEQSKISLQALATLPFSAYSEELRLKAAIVAFGVDVAKEIFPGKETEIDLMVTETPTDEVKNLAQQMEKVREEIISAKLLESDDGEKTGEKVVEAILNIIGEKCKTPVTDEFLNKIKNVEEFKKSLNGNVNELIKVVQTLQKSQLQQAIVALNSTIKTYITSIEQEIAPSTEEQGKIDQQESPQQQESVEQKQDESQQQKTAAQQKQKSKKVRIRSIIAGLFLSLVLIFSSINIGEAFATEDSTTTTQTVTVTTVASETDTNQMEQEFQEPQEETVAPKLSYNYFNKDNLDYCSKTEDDFNRSIEFSQRPEIQRKVKEAFKILGINEESGINVVFMFNTNVEGETACAFGDINTVIIPITDSTVPKITTDYIVTKLAHETVHLVHYEDVQAGRMSAVLDETMATESGIVWDNGHEQNIAFNTRYHGIQEINHVGAMELVAFYSANDYSEQIFEEFRNLGATNPQIFYAGVFWGENDLNDPTIPVHPDLSPTEVAIRWVDQNTGASLLFVVDTHIDINTAKADESCLKKDEKGKVFVEANTKDFRFIEKSSTQQHAEQETPTQQEVKTSRDKLPLLAFLGSIGMLILGFLIRIISPKKSKAKFKDDYDIATFLINKDGKIYSLTAKTEYLTDEDERSGDYIDVGIRGRKLVLYLSSAEGEAYLPKEEEFKAGTEIKTIEKIEEYFPGLKIKASRRSVTVRSSDTKTSVDVIEHKKNSGIVSSLKKRELPISEKDKEALEILRKEFGEPQTIYLDREEKDNIPIAEKAFNEKGLLVVYPFSNFYETKSIKDTFSLYLQLKRNLNVLLRDRFPMPGVDYFLGVTIIYEFIKNAIVHGNSADIFRPIYIKYDEDGFTVYNVYTDPKENPISTEELKKRLSLSAAADLSGAHAGLKIIREHEKKGHVSVTQNGQTKISNMDFYAAGVKFPTSGEQQQQTTPQVEQQSQQEQEIAEGKESIVTDDRTKTIVFNKKSLRNLISSIKEKLKNHSKKKIIFETLEQSLSEIEKNPTLVAMQGESVNDVKFNVCEFRSLQTFIEDANNKALAEAINEFLLSAIFASRDNKINKDEEFFTISNYRAVRNYIHDPAIRNDVQEQKRRLEQIKVIARLYGYISFKNEFFKDDNNKDKPLTNNSVVRIEDEEGQTQELTLYQWIHICDGHSICLSGNEVGERSSSPEKYQSDERAFKSAITMAEVLRAPTIKANPDIVIFEEGKNVYVKKMDDEYFYVLVESVTGDLVTMYAVDGKIIKNADGEYNVSGFIENFNDPTTNLDVFINQNESMFYLPPSRDFYFKREKNGKISRYKDKKWEIVPKDENGFVQLSLNVISPEENEIVETRLMILQLSSGSYYYDTESNKWFESVGDNLVEMSQEAIDNKIKSSKEIETFTIDGKNYYFSAVLNYACFFDENLNLIQNDAVLELLTDNNGYATYVEVKIEKGEKKGNIKKKYLLLFDYSAKKWVTVNLSNLQLRWEQDDSGFKPGVKSWYVLPGGLLVTMDGITVENVQEPERKLALKNKKGTVTDTYLKVDGKWYNYRSSGKPRVSPDTMEFDSNDTRYLYIKGKVYEITDEDDLVEIQDVDKFDVNGKKYMNLNSQLYEIKEEEIVPVNEEQANNLKADSQYGEWFKLLLDRTIPVGLALSLVSQIFDANKSMKMKGKNIIVDYNTEIDEELIETAKSAGINIVKLRIIEEAEAIRRGGALINEQAKIRMAFDSSKNELLVYSKQGINLDTEKIKELIAAAYSEGRKDLKFTDEQVIAFAENGEVGINLGVNQSLINIQNRIANAAIDGVKRAEVEVSLDLSGMKNIGRNLASKCNIQSASTIIIDANQLNKYGSEINGLRAAGFRFILRGENIDEIRTAFGNPDFKLDGAILKKATKTDLAILEDLAAGNTEGTLHIETQMYVDMATAKGLDANRIYDDNGIIPIVTADQVETMTGKYAVRYSEIKNKIDNTMLGEGKIVNILCTEDEGNRPDDLRSNLAGIFSDLFGTMNELLKPKSPEQRISEENAAVSDYNFGEDFRQEIKNVREKLLNSLKDLKNKDNIIRIILTTEVTEDETAKELLKNIEKNPLYQQMPSVIRMRVQTQMTRGNYFEAIGTIRGAVNQIIDSVILAQWENKYENLTPDKQREKRDELRKEYLGKDYKEYRQYARIIITQLLMSKEILDLDSLVKMRPDTNQRVEELFNEIKITLNKGVIKSIIENKTAIKEITPNDEGNTITNLGNIIALLEGSLITASSAEKLDIPIMAVKSILAAA